ncbi:T-box transcription factor [Hirschfeldia incana]|nr:T-box transcription factor [Hirschfeldia incana]KAJ0241319.1 T-box transcription factor [Hirschfeldia incana]
MVHCESFLSSMRDLSKDSNTCSRPSGDKNSQYHQNGFSMRAPPPEESPYFGGHEREFLKQTMLQHEAVFKNQVHELHRLYRTQKSLMDEVKRNNRSVEHTPESVIKRDLPAFLLGKSSVCGEGSSSQQACNVPMANGIISSKEDKEEEEVRPVKVRRRMIDLQLPADEYLDDDGENTTSPQEEAGEKLLLERGNASSHLNGSSLVMKAPNGLTDLNEPVQYQESSVHGPSSDIYSLYGKNIANAQRQWLETSTSQNGWMVLEAGHGKSIPRENLCVPSQSVQVLANHAFQPLGGYPSTRHRNPEVSYDSYVESSVASNAPSLTNGYHRPEPSRTWSHWIPTSRENRSSSSSVQRSLPFQTNPFLSFNAQQPRADSSSEMRRRGCFEGFSSGSKETAFSMPPSNLNNHLNNGPRGAVTNGSLKHQSFESLQGPKTQECSAGLPWIKPKPTNKNGVTNGGFDLNASAGSEAVDGLSSVSTLNGLRSFSSSNDPNLGRTDMASSLSNGKISQKRSIWECNSSLNPSPVCLKEANTLVNRNFDINLPCDASASEALVLDKEEGNKAGTNRNYIDLNLCASEDESSGLCSKPRVETRATPLIDLEAPPTLESEEKEEGEQMLEKRDEAGETTLDELIKGAAEAIVTISLFHSTDEAASSTTDAAAKDPLSWFANTIASCGSDLEKKIDACREECSSGEVDYFEAMTLSLPPTKEEDYMPTPLVPEHLKFDGTESVGITANRPRRGQARRGRPRRDFQRDVLPGLASLSRLEVTEDLQMFEGLMKATGCNWNSGVARRSSNRGGSSRGRKRLASNVNGALQVCPSLEQPVDNSNAQMVGLEDRSLTGWGNATRRPRRQRCPAAAGAPPTVVLT